MRGDGANVTACWGNGDDSKGSVTACLVFDELGAVTSARPWSEVARVRRTAVLDDGTASYTEGELKICAASGAPCETLELDLGPDKLAGWTNPARTHAAIARGTHLVFIDLRTEKQIGDVELPVHFSDARFVGERVIVTEVVEQDETRGRAHSLLVAPSGEHVDLGTEHIVVDAELVLAVGGKQLRAIDVATLAATPLELPGKAGPDPVGRAAAALFSDRVVIAHARPAGIAFYERGSTRLTTHAAPLCD